MCHHPDWGAAQGGVGLFNLLSFLLLSLPQALPLTLVIRVRSITHLQGGGCPWEGSGCQGSAGQHHQVPAPIREGTTRTELGTPWPPGRAASGIALELALAVPCASAAPAARPWVRPMSPPTPNPGTLLPAGGCTAAREEALPSPITALSWGLLQGRVAWPPLALICTGCWPRLCSQSPFSPPAPGVAPTGLALQGRRLGSLPPLSFLKFKIHLSQEEGKLLPLKPLALSSKSSLLCRRRLLAPAGPGRGGPDWLPPPNQYSAALAGGCCGCI